jgi:hypothetical protein
MLAVSACASGGNTLAQDLALERWEQCRGKGVVLQRITRDGQIWVTYTADHGTALRDWQECERTAFAEQGRRRTAATAPRQSQTASGAVIAQRPIQAPVWKVGNEWAYRYENPSSSGTFVWSVDRLESCEDQPHYVVKTGSREIFYRVSDLAFSQETVDKAAVRRVTLSDWRWVAFPLEAGRSWDMKYVETRAVDRQTEDVERSCTAEAEETITVPAGTFSTVRVRCKNTKNGAWFMTVWYAPEVGQLVREESMVTGGRRVRELLSYRLR